MSDPIDLLVIAAHPDDAELSLGGTLLVARDLGYRTGIVDLTRGEMSSLGDLETRAAETEVASRQLDLCHRENLELPDCGVRDDAVARERLVRSIRRLRPRVVLGPWKEDLHPDHAAAGRLLERAYYPAGVGKFAPGDAPHRPELIGYYMCHTPFPPTVITDVTSVWSRREELVRAYGSQFFPQGKGHPPTKISAPFFMQAIEGRARDYGSLAGVEFGEPLRWELPPRVVDPLALLGRRKG